MTTIEFFDFQNFHIKFKLKDGRELSGVLIDPMHSSELKKSPTLYDFITTHNMIEWKKADENKNYEKKLSLQSELDIADIVRAEKLPF